VKKALTFFFFIIVLTIAGIPFILWWSTLQTQATVNDAPSSTDQSIAALQQQIISSQLSLTSNNTITLSRTELNQLLSYYLKQGINQQYQQPSIPITAEAKIDLGNNSGTFFISIKTPLPVRPYINISIDFTLAGSSITFTQGSLGIIPFNARELQQLYQLASSYLNIQNQTEQLITLAKMIQHYDSNPQKITIQYQLDQQLAAQLSQSQLSSTLTPEVMNALPIYMQYFAKQARQLNSQYSSLSNHFQTLFGIAMNRTQNGANPSAENKAIIIAMTLQVASGDLIAMLELSDDLSLPNQPVALTLNNRSDLAQHFLVSAAITVFSNKTIADQASLYKELEDSQTTHFDPADLIADRAGSLFASKLSNDTTANVFQSRAQSVELESDFFPATRLLGQRIERKIISSTDNPEQLFKGIDQLINSAIKKTPLYR
jgi:hypothetical protein